MAASMYKANWITERISLVIRTWDCFLPLLSLEYILKCFSFYGKRGKDTEMAAAESIRLVVSIFLVILTSWKPCFLGAIWHRVLFSPIFFFFMVSSFEDTQIFLVRYLWGV